MLTPRHYIDRTDAFGVIAKEAAPGLRRRTWSSHHVLGDRSLVNFDAELEELPWIRGAPQSGLAAFLC
jgi:hypothetical protein